MSNLVNILRAETIEAREKRTHPEPIQGEIDILKTLSNILENMNNTAKDGKGWVRYEIRDKDKVKKFYRAADYLRKLDIDIEINTMPDYTVFYFIWDNEGL